MPIACTTTCAPRSGIILNAEILTPAPSYSGLLRLRADVMRQVDENQFTAERAGLTSSRIGIPSYEFRASQMTFTDVQQPSINFFTGQPEIDPATGEQVIEHQRLATSTNNSVWLGPVPVFYWPRMATDLEEPTYYVQRALVRQDTILGSQVLVTFNAFQLLGIKKKPPGLNWTLSADYFSLRGPAAGTDFKFDRPDFLGIIPGRIYGIFDAWGIEDKRGYDTLGRDRRMDTFDDPDRGRIVLRERQQLPLEFPVHGRSRLDQRSQLPGTILRERNGINSRTRAPAPN